MPRQKQAAPGAEKEMAPRPDHGEKSYRGAGKLSGKAALITGADSGIGRAVAVAFAREGADIVFTYLSEQEKEDAEETVRLIEDAGRKAVAIKCDVGEETCCEELVETTIEELGKLDILVNNAAYQQTYKSILEVETAELERTFRTNVFGTFFMTKHAFPKMEAGGAILTTVSVQAFHPSPSLLPYACTKGSLLIFTKAFALEAIKKGIRVNGVAPGPIWTPLIPTSMPAEQFGASNPTGRPGQPVELAPVYVLLASDEASYVTGEVWGVTGGAMAE